MRNEPGGSPDVFDIFLAEVQVPNAAATTTAGQVKNRAWWLSGSGYIGLSTAQPPVEPGAILREHNTGITYIGTTTGAWLRQYTHLGPIEFGERVGWDNLAWDFVRAGNVVTMSMRLQRTSATVTDAVEFGDLMDDLRPPRTWWGTYSSSTHDSNPTVAVTSAGKIILAASGSKPITNGAVLVSNMTWPTPP